MEILYIFYLKTLLYFFYFSMLTMGEEAPITSCTINCIGQGPVVSVQPISLNFGEIQVLQNKVMNFRIINDSPIPAQFKLISVNIFQINALNNALYKK